MRILIYILLLAFLFSCKEYKVYQYNSDNIAETRSIYCIQQDNRYQFIVPDRLNWSYFYNIEMGFSEEELMEAGSEKIISGREYSYKIVIKDSSFVYKKISDSTNIEVINFPFDQDKRNCFKAQGHFFELSQEGGRGISNEVMQPWSDYTVKLISDTTYFFESKEPHSALVYEMAPLVSLDSLFNCSYSNPIKVIIDKGTGLPLSFEYQSFYFDGDEHDLYTINISCNDYKVVRVSRSKLMKLLW